MTNEEAEAFERLLNDLHDMIPFKRIVVPKHLLERWDEAQGDGRVTKELAFTVDKDFEATDEELWDLMMKTKESIKDAKEIAPPTTGLKKTKLM